jgi:nitrate reductase gamma subunit
MAGAWIVLALLPFTRLIHMLVFPAGYPIGPPQKVVWAAHARARSTVLTADERPSTRR